MEPVWYEENKKLESGLAHYSTLLLNVGKYSQQHISANAWGSGRISYGQIKKMLGLPQLLSRSIVKRYEADFFQFFINLCTQPNKLCFDLFDVDRDGSISKDDCYSLMSSIPCLDFEHDEFVDSNLHQTLARMFTKKKTKLTLSAFERNSDSYHLVAALVEYIHQNQQLERKLFFLTGENIKIPKKPSPRAFSFLHKDKPDNFSQDGEQNLDFLEISEREAERPWDKEGILYEQKKQGMFSKYFYRLIDDHLYAFKKKESKQPKFLVYLRGFIVRNVEDTQTKMTGLEIVKDKYCRRFYIFNKDEVASWQQALIKATRQSEDGEKDYRLVEKLGEGRSGVVWMAESPDSKRHYAIKCINRNKSKKALCEMDFLKTLKHPNIVKVHRIYQNADQFRIVEQLGYRGTLRQYIISQEYIDEEHSKQIVRQLASALCYMKRKGVLHRDIKPENVILTDHHYVGEVPKVKFVDFGLCTSLAINETCEQQCGTLCFSAPEILQGKPYSFEADVYSLGVLFYELLSRSVPYEGIDRKSVLEAMKRSPRYDENEGFECLSGDTESLLKKMLEKNPKKRIHIEQVYAKLSLKRRKFSSL